jgi:hypothetical protein
MLEKSDLLEHFTIAVKQPEYWKGTFGKATYAQDDEGGLAGEVSSAKGRRATPLPSRAATVLVVPKLHLAHCNPMQQRP